jgi:hypothetical protein
MTEQTLGPIYEKFNTRNENSIFVNFPKNSCPIYMNMITMCMMGQYVLVSLTKCDAVVGNIICPPNVPSCSPSSGGIYPPSPWWYRLWLNGAYPDPMYPPCIFYRLRTAFYFCQ